MQMTDRRTESVTTNGYQIYRTNDQEHVYDRITNNATEDQLNHDTWKKRICSGWPVLLTALITAVISITVTFLTMYSFRDMACGLRHDKERINSTTNEKLADMKEEEQLQSKCERPWQYFNCHWYYFETRLLNFHKAQMDCKQRNSNLVKIDDAAENSWLISEIKDKNITSDIWIGANFTSDLGSWKWVSDNSDLRFKAWGKNLTVVDKRYDLQDCGIFRKDQSWTWHYKNCNKPTLAYICEKN